MCFFFKRKKQKKLDQAQMQETMKNENTMTGEKTTPQPIPEPTPTIIPVLPIEPKVEPIVQPTPEIKPIVEEKKEPKSETPTTLRYSGKYEIYPEAGGYKFRLKASNGEILVVSQTYASKAGATSGIETFKKNVVEGVFEFYTDKSGYTQFLLYTSNKSRLIATGEFYESVARSQSAAESVKKFVSSTKINTLDAVDPDDVREELIQLKPIEAIGNGKFEFDTVNGESVFRLKASNGEVLFESSGYKTKASALQGLEAVKVAIDAGQFRVMKDKQGRYQFKLFAANKALLITGETYPNKDNCISALDSVRRFYAQAKVVE